MLFDLKFTKYRVYIVNVCMWILFCCLWLIFGSLGSVVMIRFADGITKKNLRGFFFWRSQCPDCKHTLQAKNLVPVVSYLAQWGKCAYCWKKISRIYPVLEILCAGIFVAMYILLQDFWAKTIVFWLMINRLLLLLLVYDLRKYELHMIVWIVLMALGVVININISGGNDGNFLMSTMIFGVTFFLIYLFAKRYTKMRYKKNMEWFWQGDIYLAVAIGVLLPITFALQWIAFSRATLINVLILFVLMSSILWLIRAWCQYFLHWILKIKNWKLHIIPFFPAMIIAFWLLSRKLPFFISLIFPLAW